MSDTAGCGPAVHLHNYPSDGRMEQALKLLRQLTRKVDAMATSFADVQSSVQAMVTEVTATRGAVASAVVMFDRFVAEEERLHAELRALMDNGTDEEVRAQLDIMDQARATLAESRANLLAAVEANPEPEPAPAPDPAPVPEPAPDPAPTPAPPADDTPAPAPTA